MTTQAQRQSISDRDRYLRTKAFIESFGLDRTEAQVILEVRRYRQPHIDLMTLGKKIPKAFKPYDIDSTVKGLIKKGYLSPYTGKKDEYCVCLSSFGRDFAETARRRGLSESIEELPALEKRYGGIKRLCYDPQGFRKGEFRYANGPYKRVRVVISEILPSEEIYDTSEDGTAIYCIRLIGKVECPRCSNLIPMDYSYSPKTCYSEYNEFKCDKCGDRIRILSSLMSYYEI